MMKLWLWVGIIFIWSFGACGEKDQALYATGRPWVEYTGWPYCELGGTYSLPHKVYCDSFFVCQNGRPYVGQCDDGLAFVPFDSCKLLHLVNCTGRPKLQSPKGQGSCPRLNGVHKDPNGCGSFYKCENGTVIPDKCSVGLEFDDLMKKCRPSTEEERDICSRSDNTLGFKCPENDTFPFGDHSRHPYPGNCFFYIMCLKDGSVKVGSCSSGTAYSPVTYNCELTSNVPGCSQNHNRLQ